MTTTQSMFEFDKSASEVLVVCNACEGVWRAFAWTMREAEASAAAHETRCHPGTDDGIRRRVRTRHAVSSFRAKNG